MSGWTRRWSTPPAGREIGVRKGLSWISVPKLSVLEERRNLTALKDELIRRWGTVALLDMLKEADWLVDFTSELTSVATREHIPRSQLQRRLLLVLYALGTNLGIEAVVSGGDHRETRPLCGGCAGCSSPGTTRGRR